MFKFGKSFLVAELARVMPGTTGAGGYFTLLATSLGRLGVKPLGKNKHRIRVEPANSGASKKLATTLTSDSWKQPQSEENLFRFSCVTYDDERTARAILTAVTALRKGRRHVAVSDEAPEHFRDLVALPCVLGDEDDRVTVFVAASSLHAPSPETQEEEEGGDEKIDGVEIEVEVDNEEDDGGEDDAIEPADETAS